MAEFSGKG